MLFKAYATSLNGEGFTLTDPDNNMPYIGYTGFETDRPSDFVWYARQFIQPTNVDEIGSILHHPLHYYMSRIPKYYRLSNVANALLHMEGDAHDNFGVIAKDIIDNSFINTATWGLDIMEALCGITTDPSKPLEDRRAVLRTRYIGNTTGTKKFLQLVATRFINGEISVENVPDKYTLNIQFVSTAGVPRNLEDIKRALEDAAPAHYRVNFKFLYLTWDELSAQKYSWDEWSNFNLEWQQVSRV
jgi:hypothetical protein